jgi:serine protease AprX
MAGMRKHAATAMGLALTFTALAGARPATASGEQRPARVVITTVDDSAAFQVEALLHATGARNVRALPVVHGFAADVPAGSVGVLRGSRYVRSVSVDSGVKLMAVDPNLGYDATGDFGSLYNMSRVLRAQDAYADGITGKGIGVALIDSGIAPVKGLTSGNVVNGPDLSFESQSPDLRYLDTFGHGTHMGSIIAGRDVRQGGNDYAGDTKNFNGVAPDARLVSVKVADHSGATDVSQVLAAIDWVVAHKNDNGMNIRVLNLSFGTDSTQSSTIDPLSFAVENAWRQGIVVVTAAGNGGRDAGTLTNPASDPYVIAVGASDPQNTVNSVDDTVAPFSSKGSTSRYVDVVAPGVHVLGLRNPGGAIDYDVPSARVGTRFFRGSGTSQSAAAVSGAVALILQKYGNLTPDQVKKHLMDTATPFDGAGVSRRGQGVPNVRRALNVTPPSVAASVQTYTPSTGSGSLEASRGSYHVASNGIPLTGEKDIFGAAFDSAMWARASAGCVAWYGGTWNGNAWSGNAWSSNDWTGNAWSGNAWSGNAWSGAAWSDSSWEGHAWSGNAWSGNAWSGSAWSGNAWSGNAWSGTAWNGTAWNGTTWNGSAWSGSAWSSSGWE